MAERAQIASQSLLMGTLDGGLRATKGTRAAVSERELMRKNKPGERKLNNACSAHSLMTGM